MLDLGKESVVEALGESWKMGRLELRVIRGFRNWIRERIGDPYAAVERFLKVLPQDMLLARLKQADAIAEELDRFSMSSPLAAKWMQTEEGAVKLAQLLFLSNHPDLTEEQAFQILQENPEGVATAIKAATGRMPGGNGQAPAA